MKSYGNLLNRIWNRLCPSEWHILLRNSNDNVTKIIKFNHGSADPFIHCARDIHTIYFEEIDQYGMGKISYVQLPDFNRTKKTLKLKGNLTHFSFPFVNTIQQYLWLTPENNSDEVVDLYKFDEITKEFKLYRNLLTGGKWVDPILIEINNSVFLIVNKKKQLQESVQLKLEIYRIDDFPDGPLVNVQNTESNSIYARNAGFIVREDSERFIRVSQISTTSVYGKGITFNKITNIDENKYREIFEAEFIGKYPMHHYSNCEHFTASDIFMSKSDKIFFKNQIAKDFRRLISIAERVSCKN